MIVIDKRSKVPVYEQIKNQIITLIRVGVYPPHSKLPSIRQISADTSINVNTVKKAFAELELTGAIYSVPGTGSFVSENATTDSSLSNKAMKDLKQTLEVARSIGVGLDEIMNLVNSVYREE